MTQSIASAFETHAKQIWADRYKEETRVCEDRYVGDISRKVSKLYKFDNDSKFVEQGEEPQNRTDRRLILVLESPHEDEYLGTENPLPANGKTGHCIRMYIGDVLRGLPEPDYGTLQVSLMNAVQYQCSQANILSGKDTKRNRLNRDEVFRKTFGEGEEFKKRVRRLHISSRDIVINCCIKGTRTPYLRDLVRNAIKDVRDHASQFESFATCHPSVWFNEKLRVLRPVV